MIYGCCQNSILIEFFMRIGDDQGKAGPARLLRIGLKIKCVFELSMKGVRIVKPVDRSVFDFGQIRVSGFELRPILIGLEHAHAAAGQRIV